MDNQLTRKVYDALKAYKPKRLIAYMLAANGGHCALGTLMPFLNYGDHEMDRLRQEQWLGGDSLNEAWAIANANNGFLGTKEERYEYMLAWCEERLGLTRMEPVPEEQPV